MALVAMQLGRTVDLIYETSATPKSVQGHISGLTCRLISLF